MLQHGHPSVHQVCAERFLVHVLERQLVIGLGIVIGRANKGNGLGVAEQERGSIRCATGAASQLAVLPPDPVFRSLVAYFVRDVDQVMARREVEMLEYLDAVRPVPTQGDGFRFGRLGKIVLQPVGLVGRMMAGRPVAEIQTAARVVRQPALHDVFLIRHTRVAWECPAFRGRPGTGEVCLHDVSAHGVDPQVQAHPYAP